MIEFEQFELANGLRVIVHEDRSTMLAAVNVLYKVGSRNEDISKTGFAHLFEHLMFGGSANVDNYDGELQRVGGENNAFTTPDITNYYLTLPATNLETGLWLESDRMKSLSFNPEVLEVQRKVVVEEFKQRYLNQPYGDVWLKLRPMAYKVHPYQWATIGKNIAHIEEATMDDVRSFFYRYYRPNNAILVVAGNVRPKEVMRLVEKYFGDIEQGDPIDQILPAEPEQVTARQEETSSEVPLDALYKVYHMPGRNTSEYHSVDLLSDLAGRGKSSRLYRQLVKEQNHFNGISAYVTGSFDPGLLVISGKINKGVDLETANGAIEQVVNGMVEQGPTQAELDKVKNQALTSFEFGGIELLNRAMQLALGAAMDDPDMVNQEKRKIEQVTIDDINRAAALVLRANNCSTLYYKSKAA